MGGASVLVLVAAFFRTKAIAWMVGPTGVGLAGILVSFNGLFAMAAGWGLATAGVRTVAAATPAGKAAKMAAVRWLGVRLSWLGLLGMLGKGEPAAGTFTVLSCNGTPGRYQAFSAKPPAGVVVSMYVYLKHLARIG